MRRLLRGLFLVVCSVWAASYFGMLHPVGDSLAVFRIWFIGLAALLALLGRNWFVACVVATIGVMPFARELLVEDRTQGTQSYRLYQKNLSFRLSDPEPILADIKATAPDAVFLQELDDENLAVLEALRADYLSTSFCTSHRLVGGVAVLSKWPMIEGSEHCVEGDGLVAIRVESPEGPVWLVSIHWFWPYPHGQAKQAARHQEILASLDGPVFIGGDFNMVRGSHVIRQLTAVTRTHRPGPIRATFYLEDMVPISIDHVFAPRWFNGRVERRDKLGSDHLGLLAEVNPND